MAVLGGIKISVPLVGAEVHGSRQQIRIKVGVRVVRIVGVGDGVARVRVVEVLGADGVTATRPYDRPRQEGGNDRVIVDHDADGRQDGAGEAFLT